MQKVVPAILEKDPQESKKKLSLLEGQAEWVQIDITDGAFVRNLTHPVSALPKESRKFKTEIHLMVQDPEVHFAACWKVGADRVIFHLTGSEDPSRTLEAMKPYAFQWGIALSPNVPATALIPYLETIDTVLLLTVQPGFQGSLFIPSVLEKIREIKGAKQDEFIGVDGGVNQENIKKVFEAGADYAAVGSAIWQSDDPLATLRKLEQLVQ